MNKAQRVCLFSRLVRSLLVYSTQDDIYSIYRRYVGCQYPGAAVERPPSASAHHASPCCEAELEATLQRQEALPLSMRLGKCSGCVGKTQKNAKKSAACPNPSKMRRKGKQEEEVRMSHDPTLATGRATPPWAEATTWAALAPSRAGAIFAAHRQQVTPSSNHPPYTISH